MKTTVLLSALILCAACSNDSAELTAKILLQQRAQIHSVTLEQEGTAWSDQQRQLGFDEENPIFMQKLQVLTLNPMQRIDHEAKQCIDLLEALKKELIQSIGVLVDGKESVIEKPQQGGIPALYRLEKITSDATSDLLSYDSKNSRQIRGTFTQFRKRVTELIVKSSSGEERQFYFHDPNITNYSDIADLKNQLEPALQQVSPDDREALIQIYGTVSHTVAEWKAMLTNDLSWIDAFGVLTSLEQEILSARAYAFRLISCRIGCCADYGFTELQPLVFGPSYVQAGSQMELRVLMVAYDQDKQPIVTISSGNARVAYVKNGQAFIQFTGSKPGTYSIKGSITILNKSGIPKTQPWEKEILVVK